MMLLPVPLCAAPEEMLTMTPSPVARNSGTKARIVANGPRTLAVSTASIARRDFSQDLVETVGSLVLRPVPGAGDHLEAGARLKAAHHAGALLEMGTSGRIALSPDAVEAGLDERQNTGERVRPREPAA